MVMMVMMTKMSKHNLPLSFEPHLLSSPYISTITSCECSHTQGSLPFPESSKVDRSEPTPTPQLLQSLLGFLLGGGSSQDFQELLGGAMQRIWQVGPHGRPGEGK